MEDSRIPVAIKIRSGNGCFCKSHSPHTNRLIDEYIRAQERNEEFAYHEHESGPEIIAWLALGTAGITLTKSIIDLIVGIINACRRGEKNGDNIKGKLILIIRDTNRTADSTEEIVLELYDNEVVSPAQVQRALEKGLSKKFNHGGGKK